MLKKCKHKQMRWKEKQTTPERSSSQQLILNIAWQGKADTLVLTAFSHDSNCPSYFLALGSAGSSWNPIFKITSDFSSSTPFFFSIMIKLVLWLKIKICILFINWYDKIRTYSYERWIACYKFGMFLVIYMWMWM